jgi:hypothetical protein
LLIVCTSGHWNLPLLLDVEQRELLEVQLRTAERRDRRLDFIERLSECVGRALCESLQVDLAEPTADQLDLALRICRTLGVSLPAQALQHRASMVEFIRRFRATYVQRLG